MEATGDGNNLARQAEVTPSSSSEISQDTGTRMGQPVSVGMGPFLHRPVKWGPMFIS